MASPAALRVCASCEWIFRRSATTADTGCPKCGFGHYSARFVYGGRAYRYAVSQKPWFDRKMYDYSARLREEITASSCAPPASP